MNVQPSAFHAGWLLPALLLSCLAVPGQARDPAMPSLAPEKTAVADGHVFHDAGLLWNHASNWGLIGACPGIATPYSAAPSARWPGEDGADHLWAAGLWVGGKVLGETLVTTGGFRSEFLPTEAALDTIYLSYQGMPGGNRYPWPLSDDDHDYVLDEDPLNGLDDDGDGLIDEDFAAASDQSFRCVYSDTAAATVDAYPDHNPLRLRVIQESFQWSRPNLEDAIGYQFTVQNIGVIAIEDLCLGFFADFDIPAGTNDAQDDMAGGWSGMVETDTDGVWVPVNLAYMHDSDGSDGSGYAAVVMGGQGFHDLPGDPPGEPAGQIFSGQAAFDNGGDPTNDSERYELLSSPGWDASTLTPDDYRVLLSTGPVSWLEPGQSLVVRALLVTGSDLEDLIQNAGNAVLAAYGPYFDPDHVPGSGDEFHVHWLPWEDLPSPVDDDEVPAVGGLVLRAYPNPFNPRLQIDLRLDRAGAVAIEIIDLRGRVVRRLELGEQPAGLVTAGWDGQDQQGRAAPSGVYRVVARSGGRTAERKVTLVR